MIGSRSPINVHVFDYLLATIWGDKERGTKRIDLFGFNDISEWPGNPDVYHWSLANETIVSPSNPEEQEVMLNPLTCGDTLIMLGQEESS